MNKTHQQIDKSTSIKTSTETVDGFIGAALSVC
jgi:hypothetical protein